MQLATEIEVNTKEKGENKYGYAAKRRDTRGLEKVYICKSWNYDNRLSSVVDTLQHTLGHVVQIIYM